MDEARYRLRRFETRDYPALATVWNRLNPGPPLTGERLRRQSETIFVPPLESVRYAVDDLESGRAVAFAYLEHDFEHVHPRKFQVGIAVDPDHQRRGIGRQLADVVNAEGERRRAETLWADALVADERGMRFLDRQGFRERRRSWRSRLDVGSARLPADRTDELQRAGIVFTTLAAEGADIRGVRQRVFDLSNECSADEPRIGTFTPPDFDTFERLEFVGEEVLPEACFLAREGDRYVAFSVLRRIPDDPSALHQGFTGTRRAWRGRGLASELKRRTVVYAREHGYRTIWTGNDSLNHPMWAINRKLGFERFRERVIAEKQLAPSTPPDASAPRA